MSENYNGPAMADKINRLYSQVERLNNERNSLFNGLERVADHYYLDMSDSFVRRKMYEIAVEEINKHKTGGK